MNDTQHLIGKILTEQQPRDAIHIAVAHVRAAVKLSPGTHVGINQQGLGTKMEHMIAGETTIGIVDPFLHEDVQMGELFWLFIYPNIITNMRHSWSHPSFQFKPGVPNG